MTFPAHAFSTATPSTAWPALLSSLYPLPPYVTVPNQSGLDCASVRKLCEQNCHAYLAAHSGVAAEDRSKRKQRRNRTTFNQQQLLQTTVLANEVKIIREPNIRIEMNFAPRIVPGLTASFSFTKVLEANSLQG
ncbi:unnamed protein product [Litomosoides sigmodontis]|uniref:Uncharacterized protein n=1 Tax=Litomosoides sigmodontis TaxID=42156 RepID=A0A3P6VC64_LITSI|nr:unnamed protein product [Litomosoides sigmodontis]